MWASVGVGWGIGKGLRWENYTAVGSSNFNLKKTTYQASRQLHMSVDQKGLNKNLLVTVCLRYCLRCTYATTVFVYAPDFLYKSLRFAYA